MLDVQAGEDALAHDLVEELDAVAAGGLGAVHRGVRVAHERVGAAEVAGARGGHADRAGDEVLVLPDPGRGGEHAAQALGQ